MLPRLFHLRNGHTMELSGTRCIGLNIVGRPGHLVAFEMTADHPEWSILGEF